MINAAQPFKITQDEAALALNEYRQHRNTYDRRDWEIERIYRAISKGKTVISVNDAIRRGGLDEHGNPKLAIMRADLEACRCERYHSDKIILRHDSRVLGRGLKRQDWYFEIPWPDRPPVRDPFKDAIARLPRIPPQHRPPADALSSYHLLWEADWKDVPRDPYLLRRIGKDAWIVLAAWDLTEVELSVLRAHAPQ